MSSKIKVKVFTLCNKNISKLNMLRFDVVLVCHSHGQLVTGIALFIFWIIPQEYTFSQKILLNTYHLYWFFLFKDVIYTDCVKFCVYKSTRYLLQKFFISVISLLLQKLLFPLFCLQGRDKHTQSPLTKLRTINIHKLTPF